MIFRAAFCLVVLSLGITPGTARAWCRTTTTPAQPDPLVCPAGGVPIAWEGGCTSVRLVPTLVPPGISLADVQATITMATNTWAGAQCPSGPVSFRLVQEAPAVLPVGYFPTGANANTVSFRDHWEDDSFHPPDAAAVTIVTYSAASARILDADTEVNVRVPGNPSGFVFSLTGDPLAADLPTILTHELGHTQGLAHSAERNAVMWYAAGRGEQRRSLTTDDTAGICAVYPPGRNEACLPDLRDERFSGNGLACTAPPARGPAPAGGPTAILLGLLATRARRMKPTPRPPRPR